jgi:hypothetical protein
MVQTGRSNLPLTPLQQPLQVSQVPDRRDSQNDRLPPGPAPQWRSAYGAGQLRVLDASGMMRDAYPRFSAAVTIC